MAARMQRTAVPIPSLPIPPLATAFVGPSEMQKQQLRAIAQDRPPVVLLHGFDSSSLEFRRLYPLLEPHTETYAVDLVRDSSSWVHLRCLSTEYGCRLFGVQAVYPASRSRHSATMPAVKPTQFATRAGQTC